MNLYDTNTDISNEKNEAGEISRETQSEYDSLSDDDKNYEIEINDENEYASDATQDFSVPDYPGETDQNPINYSTDQQDDGLSYAVVKDADSVAAEKKILTPEKKYKKTLRGIFLILCLFPIISLIAVVPTLVYEFMSYSVSSGSVTSSDTYYIFTFAIPQILYPVLTAIASVFMVVVAKRRIKDTVIIKNAPAIDVLLSIGIFLGIGTVGSYISEFITDFIISLGIPVPDMSEYIPDPKTPLQFCLYLIVIAVLPAICEEFIFRGVVCGLIKEYNKTAAIILSSLAFSLVHATVQQIPFAFIMGIFLGYLYIRYDTLLIGIVLHFINNFISCIFMALYNEIPEETYEIVYTVYDIATVVIGIAALVFFIVRRARENRNIKEKHVSQIYGKKLFGATISSWAMWLFIIIFAFETVTNIFLTSLY